MKKSVTVKRTGNSWAVFIDGEQVEDGFTSRREAKDAARVWRESFSHMEEA